jgi:hypothetical protein
MLRRWIVFDGKGDLTISITHFKPLPPRGFGVPTALIKIASSPCVQGHDNEARKAGLSQQDSV